MNRKTNFPYHKEQDSHSNRQAYPLRRQEPYLLAACSVFAVFFLLCFFRRLAPFVYQTNDDLFLRMIASGEMSGEPESRLHFISYPAGLLLSLLYRSLPSLPWYGLFLCASFCLTLVLVLYALLRREKTLSARCLTVLLFCMLSYSFLFVHIASLQFTTSAGIAAAGALFLFSLSAPSASFRETLKNNACFLLLSAYAFCIRNQVLFMCLPFLGMIGLGKYLDMRKLPEDPLPNQNNTRSVPSKTADGSRKSRRNFLHHKNRQQKNLLLLGFLFLAMLASFLFIEKTAYHSSDWRSFRSYSDARASVYDYEGYPDYDTWQDTYQELGITRSSYEAAAHRYSLMLEPAIDQHSMEVLEEISSQKRTISPAEFPQKLKEMTAFFLERHRSDADKPLNLLVYRCYLLFILCALFSRKWRAIRDILFALSARMVVWSWLVFNGRLPVRISQSVYLAELAVLFAVAFRYRFWQSWEQSGQNGKKVRCSYAVWGISILLILFTCIRSGIPNAKAAAEESAARLTFSESFTFMKDYFHDHPDHFYYLDTNSFAYFTEDALSPEQPADSNYLFMGGWAAKSPWYDKKLKQKGILDPASALYENPSVHAVFMNTEETGYGYLEDFYAENYPGVSLEVTETVDAGNGLSFLIVNAVSEKAP